MKVAIVDVCHTLYSSNTTFSFIDYVIRKKYNKSILIKNKLFKLPLLIFGRLFKQDIYRRMYVMNLSGLTRNDLKEYASDYYNDVLQNVEINIVFDLIKNNKQQYRYFLCSASLDVIIEAIACNNELFEHEFFSSKLAYKNDICIGRLDNDLLGNKHLYIKNVDWLITDNKSDLKLARKAKETTIISKRSNIKFWVVNGFEVDVIT